MNIELTKKILSKNLAVKSKKGEIQSPKNNRPPYLNSNYGLQCIRTLDFNCSVVISFNGTGLAGGEEWKMLEMCTRISGKQKLISHYPLITNRGGLFVALMIKLHIEGPSI